MLACLYDKFQFKGIFCARLFDILTYIAVACGNDMLYVARFKAVGIVLFLQLICCGNKDSADFFQRKCNYPHLPVALEDGHYLVALFHALVQQHICSTV